tara:strand:- start:104 stop:235 length:132 start_codon:yes stop_codon:yes gene_type:complete
MKEVLGRVQSLKSDEYLKNFVRQNYGVEMACHFKVAEDDGLEM